MLIASSGVLHFFKAPDTNSIYLTHRPDRADQNCPAFFIPRMTKYCNKYCNTGEKVLLHRQKCVIDHRNIRHSLRNSPPDCFCQMLRIWSLVSQVQILQINKKRKQDIPAAPPAEISNRAQRYKALAAKQSPGLFLPNASHLEPRVTSSNLVNKQKRKQDISAAPPAEMSNRHRDIRHSLRNSPPDCFCQMLRIWSLVSQVQILQINKKGSRTF